MKQLISLFCLFFFACALNAQAPNALNYQGVARNSNGTPITNQNIRLRLSVLVGNPNGGTVFQETHNQQTNQQGLYSTLIGLGTLQSGNFSNIDWGQNQHYLKVEIDPNGGNNFVQVGTPALLASVPYALEAQHAGSANETTLQGDVSGSSQSATVVGLQNLPVSSTMPNNGQVLKWSGTEWAPAQDATSGGGGGGGFTLPYNGSGNNSTGLFKITNTGTGSAIHGITNGGGEAAVVGEDPTGGLAGVRGYSSSSYGVLGASDSGIGVFGQTSTGRGVVAESTSSIGTALEASNLFGGKAVEVTGEARFNNGLYVSDGAEIVQDGGSFAFKFEGTLRPDDDNLDFIGTSAHRWRAVYAANGTINTSDATLKRDIKPLNYGIKDLMQLQPVSYQWIDGHPDEGRFMGFLAQDLQKVIPEVVRDKEWVYEKEDRSTGHWQPAAKLGVAYSEIIPVLTNAIQEQQAMIEHLKQQNERLEARVQALEKR
jgi:hypothetical protein